MKKNLMAIRIVIIFIITLFNFVAHAQENRQSALDEVIEQMNAQNKRLQDTNSIFKSELIPAIEQEMRKINSRVEKLANNMGAKADLHNEKLSRLIDILKAFAIEQGKVDQALQVFLAEQGKIDQVLQGQKKLGAVLQEFKKALQDLRNKANVNISRNDGILKKVKKIK